MVKKLPNVWVIADEARGNILRLGCPELCIFYSEEAAQKEWDRIQEDKVFMNDLKEVGIYYEILEMQLKRIL